MMGLGAGFLGIGFMWLWMLVPIGLLLAIVWLGARAANGGVRAPNAEADQILRHRLASGAIGPEQYRAARAGLGLPEEP